MMCLVASSDACAKTLYLKPNNNWKIENARFAVYAFGSGEAWYSMTAVSGDAGYYQTTVDDKYPQVIFCRMNPNAQENKWDNKWNQTQDMTVEADKNLCVISEGAWDNGGSWSTYGNGGGQGGEGGQGQGGEGGQGGEQGGSGNTAGKNFYAMGWINGADAGEAAYASYDDKYKFADGKLTIDCQMGSYIAVKDDDGNYYYSKTNTTIDNTTVTLDWADGSFSNCQKWAIPQGVNYIIMREVNFKGQIKLERVDKATYDAYHLDMGGGSGEEDSYVVDDYDVAVPSQSEDVMLQAFYWNSHGESDADRTYGTSTWTVLNNQAADINGYFDLVWLAPSCRSKDKMGYLPMQYPNQNNSMGTEGELTTLISSFHRGGTKVIADVVINHMGDQNWVNFLQQDFGTEYGGSFSPQSTWITSNDEGASHGQVGTHTDDGQENNANYPSARDWDHQNTNVQNMCKAYLKFLKGKMKYDGFRFDYCGGFHVSHVDAYVSSAKPYLSVMEYWNGDPNVLKQRIDDAHKHTMTFDFASFYTCYQQGIASNKYDKLINPGMRGKGYAKYAVSFVDNHDTFNRSDIGNTDCGNSTDGHSSLQNKELILQCNAYMLSMPGIPCVFWPHWYTYKSDIQKMIMARKSAGVHSESAVQEQSGNGWYKATVTGKKGTLILYLGSAASESAPEGYKTAIKTNKVAMYYTGEWSPKQDVEQVPSVEKRGVKYLQNGQLRIVYGDKVYDVTGRQL